MSLLDRERLAAGLCVACGHHATVLGGNRCADCLNDLLRATRPASIRQPAWIERARQQPNGLARALDLA